MCYLSLKKRRKKKAPRQRKSAHTDDASSTSMRVGINSQVAKRLKFKMMKALHEYCSYSMDACMAGRGIV
jgi:hypothetical protein